MNRCDAIDRPNPRLWDARTLTEGSVGTQRSSLPDQLFALQSNIYATSATGDKCHTHTASGEAERIY
jgi:hypothetical protein